MRTLIYVPLVHTAYESLTDRIRKEVLGDPDFRWRIDAITRQVNICWKPVCRDIARIIRALPPSHPRVQVWRDGLLIDLRPRPSVRFPPRRFPTHAALVWLYRQGARICATEHPKLLKLQLQCLQLLLDLPGDREAHVVNRKILAIRDGYVAQRVLDELAEGHTGILMMGCDHRVDRVIRKIDPRMRIIRIPHFQKVNREVKRILAARKPRR